MSAPVTLLMAVHCHQPVGNFGFVFEEAYAKAYEPFLRVLERHPRVRLALHYSGCLLDWITQHQPEFITRLRVLVTRGQVELLASGYYEPILPLLPEDDRQGQIGQMRAALQRHFGEAAEGLWLTERVWEPELPRSLARAGIRYTMVDTNQFAAAKPWLPRSKQVQDDAFWDVLGCYTTEYAGSSLILFPASKRLRYWMPFRPAEETIEFLRRLKRDEPVAVTFADDGEKFGLWPKTHHWVYEEGWLEQWFSALEREGDWLRTDTFRDYLAQHAPDGRVALPSGSYDEMLEWSGGHFRNFFTKYPEANAIYQKMLRVSHQLTSLKAQGSRLKANAGKRAPASSLQPPAKQRDRLLRQAEQALYAGQCNCAYWHGVFGGLYLSHLRRAVYERLIQAEQLTDQATGVRPSVSSGDLDADGCEEVSLRTSAMSLVVDPVEGGALTEWTLFGPRVNLLDTLTRRYEPYHEKLKQRQQVAAAAGGGTPASIHDMLGTKEDRLESYLVYDDHRRSAFLDYGLQSLPQLHDVVRSSWAEHRLWSPEPFQWERRPTSTRVPSALDVALTRSFAGGTLRKSLRLSVREPVLECAYVIDGATPPVVALEFNLGLRDERFLRQPQEHAAVTHFTFTEPALGTSVTLCADPPATLYHFPLETVSESEEGLERTYQGLSLLLLWAPAGQRRWSCTLRWSVEAA